jgi:hypothetical protein
MPLWMRRAAAWCGLPRCESFARTALGEARGYSSVCTTAGTNDFANVHATTRHAATQPRPHRPPPTPAPAPSACCPKNLQDTPHAPCPNVDDKWARQAHQASGHHLCSNSPLPLVPLMPQLAPPPPCTASSSRVMLPSCVAIRPPVRSVGTRFPPNVPRCNATTLQRPLHSTRTRPARATSYWPLACTSQGVGWHQANGWRARAGPCQGDAAALGLENTHGGKHTRGHHGLTHAVEIHRFWPLRHAIGHGGAHKLGLAALSIWLIESHT